MEQNYIKKILAQADRTTVDAAIIEGGICANVAVFQDMETAASFFEDGVWPDAEAVLECPAGYGIGDFYDSSSDIWTKKPEPEPEPQPEPEPDPFTETMEFMQGFMEGYAYDEA